MKMRKLLSVLLALVLCLSLLPVGVLAEEEEESDIVTVEEETTAETLPEQEQDSEEAALSATELEESEVHRAETEILSEPDVDEDAISETYEELLDVEVTEESGTFILDGEGTSGRYFSTMDELKARIESGESNELFYSEDGNRSADSPFVFTENIEIPSNVSIYSWGADFMIAEDVTVINQGEISCAGLEVQGTLVNSGQFSFDELQGADNVKNSGHMMMTFSPWSVAELQTALARAAADDLDVIDSFEIVYQIDPFSDLDDITLTEDILIPYRTRLTFVGVENDSGEVEHVTLVIPEGVTLTNYGWIDAVNLCVYGSLINGGYLDADTIIGEENIVSSGGGIADPNYNTFSSFEELKALAAQEYNAFSSFTYEGSMDEPFIILSNITIPNNLCLFFNDFSVVIPSGVSVIVDGEIDAGTLQVEGSLQNNGFIQIDVEVSGEKNIQNSGTFYITVEVTTETELRQAAEKTYEISDVRNVIRVIRPITLTRDLLLRTDKSFEIEASPDSPSASSGALTIAEGFTLCCNGSVQLRGSAQLNILGSLEMLAGSMLTIGGNSKIVLDESGDFHCNGEIWVWGDALTEEDALAHLSGFPDGSFKVSPSYGVPYVTLQYTVGLTQLATPSELQWGKEVWWYTDESGELVYEWGDIPGLLFWKNNSPSQNEMYISIYRVGETYPIYTTWSMWGAMNEQPYMSIYDFINLDLESGDYYFTVTSKGDGTQYYDSETVTSGVWTYVKPSVQLGMCTDLRITGDGDAYARNFTFVPPEEAMNEETWNDIYTYAYEIRFAESANTEPYRIGCWYGADGGRTRVGYIYNDVIRDYGVGYYSVRVRALSADITKVGNGPWTEWSEPVNITEIPKEVAEELADILYSDMEDASEVRAAVQAIDDEDALISMLVNDSAVTSYVSALEEKIGGGAEVVVTDSVEAMIVESLVSVVGAALNTPVEEDEPIRFVIDKPEKEHVIPEAYNNSLAVKFSMTMENIVDTEALDFPVRVTLPVPDTINPGFLVLLHYHASGDMEQIWPVITYQGGQAYASFVLTSFSDFVMTEVVVDEILPGDINGDGSVDLADLIRIMKLINKQVDSVPGNPDVNGDGDVNARDLIRLMKFVNGQDVEIY